MKQRFTGFYYEPKNSLDVVYIGSSPVHPYWEALLAWDMYGFTSHPLSTNVQQPKAALGLLKETLKIQNPKVLIFELRMFNRTQTAFDKSDKREAIIRNITDNLKISTNRINVINTLVNNKKERINYYFDIVKYHTLWKDVEKDNWKNWDFENIDANCGHLIVDKVVDLSQEWHNYSNILSEEAIPSEQEIVLRELLEYCKEQGIEALFTINPYTDLTEEIQKNFNYMKSIIENEYQYPFINFNTMYDELEIDFSSDFYNGSHMNAKGAEKFTRYLGKYLSEHYNLEDKRGKAGYKSWDERYELWKAKSDAAIQTINQKVQEGAYDE